MIIPLYIPPLGTKFTLTQDWSMADMGNPFRNQKIVAKLAGIQPYPTDPDHYTKVYAILRGEAPAPVVPAGTVFEIKRYHLGQSEERISLKVLASPDRRLNKQTLFPSVAAINRMVGEVDVIR